MSWARPRWPVKVTIRLGKQRGPAGQRDTVRWRAAGCGTAAAANGVVRRVPPATRNVQASENATLSPRCCANGKKSRSAWSSVSPSSMHRVAMSVSMVFRMVIPIARNDR